MTAQDKQLVVHVYDQLFSHGNLDVIDEYFGPQYINHNPQAPDGTEALRRFVTGFHAAYPNLRHTVERVIAEDDLVLLHSHAVLEPGTNGQVVVDIFRVRDGKIVEHWDVIQPVPDTSVSGHDMFTTLSTPAQSLPDPAAPTEAAKKPATALFHELTVERDVTALDRYAADPFYEHNPQHADGIAAAKQLFTSLFAEHPQVSIDLKRVIAEGDYVAFHHHLKLTADHLGLAVIDIFRVRDGKIVEHWDAAQPVPDGSANDNTMF
jgi:predicted SnoaL-like aldol condensation-catalyzing enzyme